MSRVTLVLKYVDCLAKALRNVDGVHVRVIGLYLDLNYVHNSL